MKGLPFILAENKTSVTSKEVHTRLGCPDFEEQFSIAENRVVLKTYGRSLTIFQKLKKNSSIEMKEGGRTKIEMDCQNIACKNALGVTIKRGLTVITFPIYLDLLVLNSLQLSVW